MTSALVLIGLSALGQGQLSADAAQRQAGALETGSEQKPSQEQFARYYEPVQVPDFKPSVPATPLPLDLAKLTNWKEAQRLVPEAARDDLRKNAFAVFEARGGDRVEMFYDQYKRIGQPLFITSDSLLHLYRIQFDETLRQIEETKFCDDLLALTVALQAEAEKALRVETRKHNFDTLYLARGEALGYFSVARKLLDESAPIPEDVAGGVRSDLDNIAKLMGPSPEEVPTHYGGGFRRSEYVPRGHYTRNEKLKRYFQAMTWYRTVFRTEDLTAEWIARELAELTLPDGRKAKDVYKRIYAVTDFFDGFADDLTPEDYRNPPPSSDRLIAMFREKEMHPPYENVEKWNIANIGMRLIGRRYLPDSYVMDRLVFSYITPGMGEMKGKGEPRGEAFTMGFVPTSMPVRKFARELDVMAALGAARARQALHILGDDEYGQYDAKISDLTRRFAALSEKEWNRNMYWSWLSALRVLMAPAPEGYPTFTRGTAWQDKQLITALGSWAELHHDTNVYAVQEGQGDAVGPASTAEGYVEPVPEFYAHLLALNRMTLKALDNLELLDDVSRNRFKALNEILERLLGISVRELQNRRLGPEDFEFIGSFGDRLKAAVAGPANRGLESILIADLPPHEESEVVLEEGTGYLNTIAVAYPMPDGRIALGFGPALSYYEFKQDISKRLTDETWKMLLHSPQAPKPLRW
jgi:hypothetical protein